MFSKRLFEELAFWRKSWTHDDPLVFPLDHKTNSDASVGLSNAENRVFFEIKC